MYVLCITADGYEAEIVGPFQTDSAAHHFAALFPDLVPGASFSVRFVAGEFRGKPVPE